MLATAARSLNSLLKIETFYIVNQSSTNFATNYSPQRPNGGFAPASVCHQVYSPPTQSVVAGVDAQFRISDRIAAHD